MNVSDANNRLLDEDDIGFVFLIGVQVLVILMNRSHRCLSHDLGNFFYYESSCFRRMRLILLSFPNCYSRLFIV